MSVKIILSLLFFVTTVAAAPKPRPYECKQQDQPANCMNSSSAIEIYKTGDTYQLRLCLNNENITFNFKCCAICDVCEILLESGDCDEKSQEQCEEKVDRFLNNYYESVSLINTTLLAAHTLEPNQTSPHVLTPNIKSCTVNPNQSESRFEAIVALGCVLGLCVILLLAMTIGWVYTCRALKTLQRYIQRPMKNSLEQRTAVETTDNGDEVERHVNNPLHEESLSVHDYSPAPRQDTTNMPPPHNESFNQNDAILNVIESGATVPLSAVDHQKEKYLKNPIYEGSLEFQADRYYEKENYDCSQDDDDYMYDALEQGSSPERDTASKRFSDSGSIARREEIEEISSICDFPVARYDAVSRPCYEEGEDYDVLDHEIHTASSTVAASSFECNKEKYLKNPIYEENPCSDKLARVRDVQAARFDRAISTFQEDSQDYDILEPESDVVVTASTPTRYEDKSLKSSSYVGGPKAVVTGKPRNLCTARYDTVNFPSHDDRENYDVLERIHEVEGENQVRNDPYCRKNYSHLDI